MTTSAAFLAELRRKLGTEEKPHGSNKQEFSAYLKRPAEPWCADYLIASARRVKLALPGEQAYTPALADAFRAAGRFGQRPALGAFAFFAWPNMGRIAHVAAVEAIHADHSIGTLEGNTDAAGGRSGGRVMRHTRRAYIVGYGYPVFTAPAAAHATARPVLRLHSLGAPVVELQRALNAHGAKPTLKLDGVFGPGTDRELREYQRRAKLLDDGVAGPATYRALGLT